MEQTQQFNEILSSIFQALEGNRTKQIISVILTIDPLENSSLIKYEYINQDINFVDRLLSYKLDGVVAMIDEQTMILMQAKEQLKNQKSQAFFISLTLFNDFYHSLWLFNATEQVFCDVVQKLILKYFPVKS